MAEEVLSADEKDNLLIVLPTIKFINDEEVKKYTCTQCGDVAIYHYMATCKHVFCGRCHRSCLNKACPVEKCSNQKINEITQSKDFEFGVYKLEAHCPFEESGCNDIISLDHILDHMEKCQYSTKKTLPKVWAPSLLYAMEELSHLRRDVEAIKPHLQADVQTELDKKLKHEMTKQTSYIETNLSKCEEKCSKALEKAEEAAQKMERKMEELKEMFMKQMDDQNSHVKTDLQQKLTAESNKAKKEMQDFKKHLTGLTTDQKSNVKMDLREKLTAKRDAEFYHLKLNSEVMKRKIAYMSSQLTEQNSYKFMWNIKGINAIVNDFRSRKTNEFQSVLLETDGQKLTMEAALTYKFQNKFVKMRSKLFMTDPNSTERKTHYEFCQTQINLIDKSDDLIRRNAFRMSDYPFKFKLSQTHCNEHVFSIPIKFMDKGSRYVKDDAVDIEIRLIPHSILDNLCQSDNGILLWELCNYRETKRYCLDGVMQIIESDDFYTTAQGYRMRMCIEFTQTQLYVSQVCLKGKYDEFLQVNFPHKTTITIFDRSDSMEKLHLTRTTVVNTVNFDPLFKLNCREIEHPKYLKDDCLLMTIIVQHTW